MDDLISRQAAITQLSHNKNKGDDEWELAVANDIQTIWKLPSAQPELCEDDPRADVYYLAEKIGIHQLYALVVQLRGEPEPCEDAVSREKVKELAYSQIRNEYSGIALKEQREAMLRIADNVIDLLPSIQPKRGQWIDDGSELGCQCSQCGKTLDEYINCGTEYMTLTEIPKFCPNCGADMREVTE